MVAQALNKIIGGAGIYESARFQDVTLRRETSELMNQNPKGDNLLRLNRLLLDDAYAQELSRAAANASGGALQRVARIRKETKRRDAGVLRAGGADDDQRDGAGFHGALSHRRAGGCVCGGV